MSQNLLYCHSVLRWLVLTSLVCSVYRTYKGYKFNSVFSKTDDRLRHWTATIAHIQLAIGIILYTQSSIIKYFWTNYREIPFDDDSFFFGSIHISMMLMAIVFITVGSAKAKRLHIDKDKYRTMFIWFSIALVLILAAIPWPFSPIAARPYLR